MCQHVHARDCGTSDMFHATQNGNLVKFIYGALLCITQSKYLDELHKDKKEKRKTRQAHYE